MSAVRFSKGFSEMPEGCVALWHTSLRCDSYYIPITSEQVERFKFWQTELAKLPLIEQERAEIAVPIPCVVVDVAANSHYENEFGLREYEMAYKVFRSFVTVRVTKESICIGTEGYEGWESVWRSYKLEDGKIVNDDEDEDRRVLQPDTVEGLLYDYNHADYWPYAKLLEIVDSEDTYLIHDGLIDCYEEALGYLSGATEFPEHWDKERQERMLSLVPMYVERYGESDPFQV